jgi:hypothetical protein
MMIYPTFQDLWYAYVTGHLTTQDILMVEKERCSLYHAGTCVYEASADHLLEEALTLLTLPWERV